MLKHPGVLAVVDLSVDLPIAQRESEKREIKKTEIKKRTKKECRSRRQSEVPIPDRLMEN
jgi:hypothetical protein